MLGYFLYNHLFHIMPNNTNRLLDDEYMNIHGITDIFLFTTTKHSVSC